MTDIDYIRIFVSEIINYNTNHVKCSFRRLSHNYKMINYLVLKLISHMLTKNNKEVWNAWATKIKTIREFYYK